MFEQQVREVERQQGKPATYEREKESLFTSLRRSCLNVSDSSLEQSSDSEIGAVWRLLLDVAKAKLRRKHVLECAAILNRSPKWQNFLHRDPALDLQLRDLPEDFVRKLLGDQLPPPPSPPSASASPMPSPAPTLAPALAPPASLAPAASQAPLRSNRFASNPFDPNDERVSRLPPASSDWWRDDAVSGAAATAAASGPDYAKLALLARAREIQANQEKILRQQAQILLQR